ncbi:hypothetical protein [Enterococcus sp. AZ180]|uniref:hypothetical protein n=1 Tax=Enterococcus sp. AZ180 TaxID=2774961 RepID=UPI003F20BBFF
MKTIKSVKHIVTNPNGYKNEFRVYRLNEFEDGYRELLISDIDVISDLNPEYLNKKYGSLEERKQIVKDRLESKNFDWIKLFVKNSEKFSDIRFRANLENKAYSFWRILYNNESSINEELQKFGNFEKCAQSIQELMTKNEKELDEKSQKIIDKFDDELICVTKGFLTWLMQNELDMQGDDEFGNEVYKNVVKLMLKEPNFADLDISE